MLSVFEFKLLAFLRESRFLPVLHAAATDLFQSRSSACLYSSPPLSVVLLSAMSVTYGQHPLKILNKIFRNEKFINFKLCTFLNNTPSLHPAWGGNLPFVQCIHAVCAPSLLVT